MELNFKLIPVYDPTAILNNWGYFIEGVEEVIKNAMEDQTLEKIFNSLLAKRINLWVGFVDGKYCGFLTTRIDNPETVQEKRFISIIHLYIKRGSDPDIFTKGFEQLKEYNKFFKCDRMRLWAIRKGWEKKLTPLGWEQTYIEYQYDLHRGN